MFYGWSLWTGTDAGRARVPIDRWQFAPDGSGNIQLNPTGVGAYRDATDADELTLIPSGSEGLLAYAARVLHGAVAIEEAWVERAKNPIPMIDLHQTIESNLKPEEAKAYVDMWNKARQENGGAAFTPYDIQANALGQFVADLYVEGRNGSRIDIANFFNMPTSLLDGSVSTASLTYSTQEGKANEVALYTVPYWRDPIVGRLSMDDVAGAGVVIRQNLRGLVSPAQSEIGEPGNE
jgi:phage portal protein BeeE